MGFGFGWNRGWGGCGGWGRGWGRGWGGCGGCGDWWLSTNQQLSLKSY